MSIRYLGAIGRIRTGGLLLCRASLASERHGAQRSITNTFVSSVEPNLTVEKARLHCEPFGATGRIRTGDLLITNQLLYQLSHSSICAVSHPLKTENVLSFEFLWFFFKYITVGNCRMASLLHPYRQNKVHELFTIACRHYHARCHGISKLNHYIIASNKLKHLNKVFRIKSYR